MLTSQAQRIILRIILFYTVFVAANDGNNDIDSGCEDCTPRFNVTGPPNVLIGENATFSCQIEPDVNSIWWKFKDANITQDGEKYTTERLPHEAQETINHSILTIHNVELNDRGNYSCCAIWAENQFESAVELNVSIPSEIIDIKPTTRSKIDGHEILYCLFKGLPLSNFYWIKDDKKSSIEHLKNKTTVTKIDETHTNTSLTLTGLNRKDNGTYYCRASGAQGETNGSVTLLVLDKPQVSIDFMKAVGAHMIYINWTTNDGNDPIKEYMIQLMRQGDGQWQYYSEHIGGGNDSYVLKKLEKGTNYKFRVVAKNGQGDSHYVETQFVRTLDEDPNYTPVIKVTGVTFDSITVSWTEPPPEMADLVHSYELTAQALNSSDIKETFQTAQDRTLYLFTDLQADTTYDFKVRPCSTYTNLCGPYSSVVNGRTMDGMPGPPNNMSIKCLFNPMTRSNYVHVSWEPPLIRNGKIMEYSVVMKGEARFKNEKGMYDHKTFGPKVKSIDKSSNVTFFDMVPPNTNYTVYVAAKTRFKKQGSSISTNCTMPPSIPDKDKIQKLTWNKIEEYGNYVFRLTMPKISERNGVICCYRIFLVRMDPQKTLAEMAKPEELEIYSYHQAHSNPKGGAYIAEMFTRDPLISVVFLGDGYVLNTTNSECLKCVGLQPKPVVETDKPEEVDLLNILTTISPEMNDSSDLSEDMFDSIPMAGDLKRVKRDHAPNLVRLPDIEMRTDAFTAYDGHLDTNSNYTGFVEIIVYGSNGTLAAYSDFLPVQRPAPDANLYVVDPSTDSGETLSLVAQVLCGLVLAVLLLLAAFCLLQRHLCRNLRGRHQLVSSHPPDMSPIAKEDLLEAYVERHRNSDLGFQQEFEQLPDRFADRTTRSSDCRDNLYKNRYPDIKAYDQTRVKLSQIDSIAGSDYVNANIVLGYKERKKFICAQGPMDNTVCDYWRMIWEQRLEIIMMLTNLEEYSKTKCAKYWPDKTEGDKVFGDISVTHVNEKRYSDYVIRELKVSRSAFGREKEERSVTQYHYLVWKDFMAPEHPHGILKFIKRMNEVYSIERGPILVHCSAGVGRTGTLVALDSLLQQLKEEGQVAIFNTICDLRHQRNFLVQSLKQYVFVYRALMEVALYGDTEIAAAKLKQTVEELKKCDKDKSRMEEEYEKLKSVMEDRKPFTVGGADENRWKNRSEVIIPYDRNRVILTPVPAKEHSTYINASFIEGYDNSESLIITQDPLDATIADFWRMISEEGITVIVMLSELGNSENSHKKCPRYWPDDENTYDHIKVKYIQSESCPYYTRRELSVKNNKTEEVIMVTQLQYHGWPTVEGEVPEVTRGLIELADQAQSLQAGTGQELTPPICVHCSCGSDRSSMFVGLCILIQQLRIEKNVNIFTTTRKLRSQRNGMINTFAQYEFLHRAIVNYADLHRLCDDET